MEGSISSLVLTQYIDESPRIEAEEANCSRSLKREHSLEGIKQATWTKRQNTGEEYRDAQAEKKGNI